MKTFRYNVVRNATFISLCLFMASCQFSSNEETDRLHLATRKGDLQEVKRLIQSTTEPGSSHSFWHTGHHGYLLHLAVQTRNKELIKYLLNLGLDPHEKDDKGYPPVFYICTHEALEAWLDNGFDIDEDWGGYGTSCYYELRSAFHNDVLDEMLKRGANINYISARDGGTVLDYWLQVDKLQPSWFYYTKRQIKEEKIRFIRKHGGKTMEELKNEGSISEATFLRYRESTRPTFFRDEPEYDKPILRMKGEEPLYTIQASYLYPRKDGPIFISDNVVEFRPSADMQKGNQ